MRMNVQEATNNMACKETIHSSVAKNIPTTEMAERTSLTNMSVKGDRDKKNSILTKCCVEGDHVESYKYLIKSAFLSPSELRLLQCYTLSELHFHFLF